MLIFLLAGHDTTAIALTFALHLLGQHPQQQERVRAEAAALGGRTPGAADAILLSVIVRDHELTSVTADVPLAPRITLHPAGPVPSRRKTLH